MDDSRYEDEPAAEPRPLKLAQVFQRARLRTKFVALDRLEGWEPGEGVWIRELTAGERSKARAQMGEYRKTEDGDMVLDLSKIDSEGDAKLVYWATLDTDAEGQPIADSQLFDARKLREMGHGKPIDVIQNMGSAFVDAVVKEIREISGLGDDAKEKEKKG
jgi:hypothetical protein